MPSQGERDGEFCLDICVQSATAMLDWRGRGRMRGIIPAPDGFVNTPDINS